MDETLFEGEIFVGREEMETTDFDTFDSYIAGQLKHKSVKA
jgi:hypothetical protein